MAIIVGVIFCRETRRFSWERCASSRKSSVISNSIASLRASDSIFFDGCNFPWSLSLKQTIQHSWMTSCSRTLCRLQILFSAFPWISLFFHEFFNAEKWFLIKLFRANQLVVLQNPVSHLMWFQRKKCGMFPLIRTLDLQTTPKRLILKSHANVTANYKLYTFLAFSLVHPTPSHVYKFHIADSGKNWR